MIFDKVRKNLENSGYTVTCFETSTEAADYMVREIKGKTIGFGGSVTATKMGLYEKLGENNKVIWHQKMPEGKTDKEVRLEANNAEVYISSVNALAETGELINIDGLCNRVAGVFYGHEKVYLIIGKNKLEKDYESALWRARNVAAPLNAKRLNKKTPCAVKGDRCYDCNSPERICCGLSVLWRKPVLADFEIILINEEIGL